MYLSLDRLFPCYRLLSGHVAKCHVFLCQRVDLRLVLLEFGLLYLGVAEYTLTSTTTFTA